MEIISEPGYREELVKDYDFAFTSGGLSLTLTKNDTIAFDDTQVVIEIAKPRESILIERRHLQWSRVRERTHRIRITASPAQSADQSHNPGSVDEPSHVDLLVPMSYAPSTPPTLAPAGSIGNPSPLTQRPNTPPATDAYQD